MKNAPNPVHVLHSPEWHDQRRLGLGSSDAAAALGLSTYKRPIDVWRDKRGLTEPEPDKPVYEWGRRLEGVIADAAADATGIDWRRYAPAVHCRAWPIAYAHLDRRGRDLDGNRTLLECKSSMSTSGWGVSGESGSIAVAHERIPAGYAIQVAHEMLVTGYPTAYLGALIGYRDFRIYRFTADEGFLADLLADEQSFWQMVVDGTEPEPDGSDAYRQHLQASRVQIVKEERAATPAQQLIGMRLIDDKRILAAAEAQYEEDRQRLDKSMGSTSRLVGPGWVATRTEAGVITAWKKAVADAQKAGLDLEPYLSAHTKPGDPGFRFDASTKEI